MPSSISGCYSQIRQFENLSRNISSIIDSLNNTDDKFKDIMDKLTDNYNVNGEVTPVYDLVKDLDDDKSKTSNYLKNSVIPAINSAIKALYRRIAQLEEEARRAAEREAATIK